MIRRLDRRSGKPGAAPARGGGLRGAGRYWQLYVMALVPMAAVFIFHYIPVYGIQVAFRKYSPRLGFWGSEWVGLKYIRQFVEYPKFWQIIWNTLRINLLGLVKFPFPIILAIMFNDLKDGWFKRTAQMITYAPHFVSTVVLCSMVLLFLNRETGVVNVIISLFGGTPRNIMADPGAFAPVFVISSLWQNLGWDTIIYLAALSSLSLELIDAAKVDGANHPQVVLNIYLPHLLPTTIVLFLLNMGSMISVGFEKVFLLQNPLNLETSTVLSTFVYQKGLIDGQISFSAAVDVFSSAISILMVVFFNGLSRKLTETSLW